MKLQFKHQQFQADAAKAVCDVFAGQPHFTPTYRIDSGESADRRILMDEASRFTGWNNHPLVPSMTDDTVLENIRSIQRANNIPISEKLDGRYNLTIEMETGTGKTYTYIKTMYELNKAYGWSKFIIVVPSVAIREGVYKTFQITQEHFAQEYGKKIRFFIYNSTNLTDIDRFASDPNINAMIINSQAFNARGKDARRIRMKLDDFRSRRPIDILAKTNPVLIIDEPQSVEGKATKEGLKDFNPLVTLRYSATHRKDSIYNMVYRLDALDAYNQKLVKKIRVVGIAASGSTATESYVYLLSVNTFENRNPTATIEFEVKGATGVRRTRKTVSEGFDLYEQSNRLDEYRDRYTISKIDGRDNSIEFVNGKRLVAGSVQGACNEDQLRRLQIRETILAHIEQEQLLRSKNIKVLSLFFIDEVAKYRQYEDGQAVNGIYARMFEEEYTAILEDMKRNLVNLQGEQNQYLQELLKHDVKRVHAGYFSIDKKTSQFKNSEVKRGSTESDDVDAYDLIMRNKERLLDKKEPVRFIFSHSALREGWDNPNVFQICTLKQSDAEVRKRQEVGRGLRLCVNQEGQRMDNTQMQEDVHSVNVLTVVASESYDSFSRALQSELAEVITDRPLKVTQSLFEGKTIRNSEGKSLEISSSVAQAIYNDLVRQNYVDDDGKLTDDWYAAKKSNTIKLAEVVAPYGESVIAIVNSVFDPGSMIENGNAGKAEVKLDKNKFASGPFKELWKRIHHKSAYVVDFEPQELIDKSILAINGHLEVNRIHFSIASGEMNKIDSRKALQQGTAFEKGESDTKKVESLVTSGTKYDLLGKIVEETGLTRKDVADILVGIHPGKFAMFQQNPEDFILKVSRLINEQKATIIVNHITYNKLQETYDTTLFTEPELRTVPGKSAMPVEKHLYNYLITDSETERKFAKELDSQKNVVIYVKLPRRFYISTPVGNYNPDWAITFDQEKVKHIYFVAETKGSMETMQLRHIEDKKIECARKHFKAISSGEVVYDVVDSFSNLLNKVMK